MILLAAPGAREGVPPDAFGREGERPLGAVGRAQAEALAAVALEERIRRLVTSPELDARETAAVVAVHVGRDPELDPRLAAVAAGEWAGRAPAQLLKDDPEGHARLMAAGERFRFPGGETLGALQIRAIAALVDVTQVGDLPALVVCPAEVVRAVLCHTDRRGLVAFHDGELPPATAVRL